MENKKGGAYSQEVDNILHRKAHAIINCYLNSPVPPKIQVKLCSRLRLSFDKTLWQSLQINAPPEIIQFIMDRIGQEQYTRVLFHEATIYVFPALFHYWKLYAIVCVVKSIFLYL